MKTKIIYISGNEVFEMAEIRAAFDQVRTTLGLGADTVLFGVPVDAESALSAPVTTENIAPIIEPVVEPVVESVVEPEPVIEPIAEPVAESVVEPEPAPEPVIPILSVLSAQDETPTSIDEPVAETIVEPEPVIEPVIESVVEPEPVDTAVISDIGIDTELTAPVETTDATPDKVTIGDMITDDAPVAPMEKTLEQLLESMTPLREDIQNTDVDVMPVDVETDDTDATLAQLATEFAENQDKIPTTTRNEGQSKIGKLKNILPFKKAKRDDSGLMGDLFGWAGIAANDEDFSLPGFFPTAASKKQGA